MSNTNVLHHSLPPKSQDNLSVQNNMILLATLVKLQATLSLLQAGISFLLHWVCTVSKDKQHMILVSDRFPIFPEQLICGRFFLVQ
jgi:hypothetical protein